MGDVIDLVIQGDGSKYQWKNCTCAAGASCLARDTLGVSHTTGARVRELTHDFVGGHNLDQIDEALRSGWPPLDHLDTRRMMAFDDAVEHIAEIECGSLWQISYEVFAGTSLDGSPGFRGNHAIAIHAVRIVRNKNWRIDYARSRCLVWDPLWDGRRKGIPNWSPTGPKLAMRWVSMATIRRGAGLLRRADNSPIGIGSVYVGFTRHSPIPETPPPATQPTPPPSPPAGGGLINYGRNEMIVMGGLFVQSSHVMHLPKGTPLYDSPDAKGVVVTKMGADGAVDYTGNAGNGYRTVIVSTRNFPDGVLRPVQVYAKAAAGNITTKPAPAGGN